MSDTRTSPPNLYVGSVGREGVGWYGMWGLIASEAALFTMLLFSYFYTQFRSTELWPPHELPSLKLVVPNTVLLLSSSLVLRWAEKGIAAGNRVRLRIGVVLTILMGSIFAAVQLWEWSKKPFSFNDHAYGSLFYVITGFHLAHVLGGVVILLMIAIWAFLNFFDEERHSFVTIGALYWHFVDAVWIFVFAALYLSPYLLR